MDYIIETQGLSKRYGENLCVRDLDLAVPEGAIYGFLGPNGAGKTTTLKMILGLARPTTGKIWVFKRELNEKNRLSILKDTGSLIESPGYYGHLTGEENLRIVQILRGVQEKYINDVLHIVRLEEHKDQPVKQYSLGMKQRLGIAYALLGYPKLLLLDEPTNGLDPAGMQEMRELITSLPKRYGMTVVISSHLLSEIDQIANHVGIIRRGELVFQDNLSSLHEKSQSAIALRTQDNEVAGAALHRLDISFKAQGGFLMLSQLDDIQVAKMSFALSEAGVGIMRIEERQKSLEDIFLELTGMAESL